MTGPATQPDTTSEAERQRHEAEAARYRRRLRGFGLHLVVYFLVMVVLVAVNYLTTPGNPWFMLPLVGWAAPLAIHAAYAMGLLEGLFGRGGR